MVTSDSKRRTASVGVGYIAATSFSGSTLLSFLLNAQPGIATVGELAWSIPKTSPGSFPCSCGVTLEQCPFWGSVSQAMHQRGHLFDVEHWNTIFDLSTNKILRKLAVRSLESNLLEQARDQMVQLVPSWHRQLSRIGRQNKSLISAISTLQEASVFVDASKDPIRVRFLREYSHVEPHVVHLVRDAPAFVNSYVKHVKRPSAFDEAIGWWNRTAARLERLRKQTRQDRWIRLRYEDLCADPERELRKLLDFFGLAGQAPVTSFRSTTHHIIGNRMRLGTSSEIRLDDGWRENLTPKQLSTIFRKTAKFRSRFGYDGVVARKPKSS